MTFLTKNLRARDARRTLDDKVAHSRHVRVARNTRHSMRAGDRTRRRTVTRQSGTEAAAASAFSLPAVPYAAGGRATASAFGRAGGETAASTMRRFVAGQSGPTTNSWRPSNCSIVRRSTFSATSRSQIPESNDIRPRPLSRYRYGRRKNRSPPCQSKGRANDEDCVAAHL